MFSWDETSVSIELLIMLVTSIVSIIILLSIEQGLFGRLIAYALSATTHMEEEPLDDDVRDVKDRVNAMTESELRKQNLVLRNVFKFYGSFLAVNEVSLEIKQ